MREYTIRFFLESQVIIEYKLTAKSMLSAESEALKKFNNNYGYENRILYMTTATN